MFDYFRVVLLAVSTFTVVAIVAVLLFQQLESYEKAKTQVREDRIESAKQNVKNMVRMESDYVVQVKSSFDEQKVAELSKNVHEVHKLATTIYEENRNVLSASQIQENIKKAIGVLASSASRQHVAINTLSGEGVYNVKSPQFDGVNILNKIDRTGSFFVKEEIKIAKERGEGYRYAIDTISGETKIVFVKEFAPYKWYFVALLYPSDYYATLRSEVANKMSVKFFSYGGDVFVYEADGRAIASRGKSYADGEYFNLATSSQQLARNAYQTMVDSLSKNPDGGFVEYEFYLNSNADKSSDAVSKKISYVRREPNMGWILGAGFIEAEVDAEIEIQVASLREDFIFDVIQLIVLFVLIILLELYMLKQLEKQFDKDFDLFISFFKRSSEELNLLQIDDLNFKEFRDLGVVANAMIEARQIVEQRLLDEQEKARDADRLKSSFLANMSHEIRTPMNAIIGFSNFLAEDLSKEEQEEFVSLIKTNGDSLLSLIDSIIDFSKIEVGQIELKEGYVSYDKVCVNLNDRYRRLIEDTRLDIEFKIENRLPVRFISISDELRIEQVLKHLIDNAFKFTSSGKITLSMALQDERIYFAVRDTGIGIAPENQQCIFDRFTQLEGNLSRSYGGTGIGLAISSKIVEMLGGEIWVESELGKGSKFQFYVPLVIG